VSIFCKVAVSVLCGTHLESGSSSPVSRRALQKPRAFVRLRRASYFLFAWSRTRRSVRGQRSWPEGRRAWMPDTGVRFSSRNKLVWVVEAKAFVLLRRASHFLSLAREKVTKERGTPLGACRASGNCSCVASTRASMPSPARQVREPGPGFSTGHPALAKRSRHPCRLPLRGLSTPPHRRTGARVEQRAIVARLLYPGPSEAVGGWRKSPQGA